MPKAEPSKVPAHEAIRIACEARLAHVMAHRERYLEAWVAETGLLPSECVLEERHNEDGSITVVAHRWPSK